ncbi:MAG: integrase arm-type DNA-binding domain-containing protein [Paracoccaceae bacterium]
MPKVAKELSALDIKRLEHPGKGGKVAFAVGGVAGLMLVCSPTGARSWVLRTRAGNERREFGLGGYPDVTLAQARERARETKDKLRTGIDPLAEKAEARAQLVAARHKGMTFAEAVDRCLAARLDAFRNEKHRRQWRATLATYAVPVIGDVPVADIIVQDVLRVLHPIWQEKTETASRLRGRIEAVLSWATVAGHRTGDNPARWAGNLKELLPAPKKLKAMGNQPALALEDAPRWFADLRARSGTGARALEFLALTAARSGEVRGARWSEIDMANGIWTVPAERMKMDREHRVALPPAAIALLKALPRFEGNDLLFPAPRGGELSDMALSAVMRRMHETALATDRKTNGRALGDDAGGYRDRATKRPAVPHGLRSTFRDWTAERTHFPGDMAEIALAHRVANAVEAAYRRGDMIEKRRRMMADWADFLAGRTVAGGKIVRVL